VSLQDLVVTGRPADQRRTKAASIADDVQAMLAMAAGLAEEIGEDRARDFFRGAATMAAHGNAELTAGGGE
jgi:hypothetical protein